MTKPIFEPTEERRMASMGFTDQQLLRRPATATPDSGDGDEIVLQIKVNSDDIIVATGDAQFFLAMTEELDDWYLVDCDAWVSTGSSSGGLLIQLHNFTQSVDMLSTRISIDVNELHSKDAAAPPVINAGNSQVSYGDMIRVDVDSAGTGARGLGVDLYFSALGT